MKKRILNITPLSLNEEEAAEVAARFPQDLLKPELEMTIVGTRMGAKPRDSRQGIVASEIMAALIFEAGKNAERDGFDAVLVNDFGDRGLNLLRSELDIPVIGAGQTALHFACTLGKKFSILALWDEWFPVYETLLSDCGLWGRLASMRNVKAVRDLLTIFTDNEVPVLPRLHDEATLAFAEDGADVIVIGSTLMHRSQAYLQERLPIPVLDPGAIAYVTCGAILDLKLSHSKADFPAEHSLT